MSQWPGFAGWMARFIAKKQCLEMADAFRAYLDDPEGAGRDVLLASLVRIGRRIRAQPRLYADVLPPVLARDGLETLIARAHKEDRDEVRDRAILCLLALHEGELQPSSHWLLAYIARLG